MDQAFPDYAQAIECSISGYVVHSIHMLGEGMDSRAFLVNDRDVFRFPKSPEVAKQLKVELALLPLLKDVLPLPIPDFRFKGEFGSDKLLFAGYPQLRGLSLGSDILHRMPEAQQFRFVRSLVDFFVSLHAFPVPVAQRCGVKTKNMREMYIQDLVEARSVVFPLLDTLHTKRIEGWYEEYLTDSHNFAYEPTVLHADLSPDHILFDPNSSKITGILDFGDVCIGDPDYDLMWMYEDYWGEPFVRLMLRWYPHSNPERLLKKLHFFSQSNVLQDVLIGVRRNDSEIVRDAMRHLRICLAKEA